MKENSIHYSLHSLVPVLLREVAAQSGAVDALRDAEHRRAEPLLVELVENDLYRVQDLAGAAALDIDADPRSGRRERLLRSEVNNSL